MLSSGYCDTALSHFLIKYMFEVAVHIAENSINENMAQCTFGFYVLFNVLHLGVFHRQRFFSSMRQL